MDYKTYIVCNFSELFTLDTLTANSFVFFVAGFETTATTISYCLYELAMNPVIQVKLREKIKQTLDANEGKITYDTLKDLTYLDMVINGQYDIKNKPKSYFSKSNL